MDTEVYKQKVTRIIHQDFDFSYVGPEDPWVDSRICSGLMDGEIFYAFSEDSTSQSKIYVTAYNTATKTKVWGQRLYLNPWGERSYPTNTYQSIDNSFFCQTDTHLYFYSNGPQSYFEKLTLAVIKKSDGSYSETQLNGTSIEDKYRVYGMIASGNKVCTFLERSASHTQPYLAILDTESMVSYSIDIPDNNGLFTEGYYYTNSNDYLKIGVEWLVESNGILYFTLRANEFNSDFLLYFNTGSKVFEYLTVL